MKLKTTIEFKTKDDYIIASNIYSSTKIKLQKVIKLVKKYKKIKVHDVFKKSIDIRIIDKHIYVSITHKNKKSFFKKLKKFLKENKKTGKLIKISKKIKIKKEKDAFYDYVGLDDFFKGIRKFNGKFIFAGNQTIKDFEKIKVPEQNPDLFNFFPKINKKELKNLINEKKEKSKKTRELDKRHSLNSKSVSKNIIKKNNPFRYRALNY